MVREREKKRNWEFPKGKLPLVWEEREKKKVEQSLDAPQICVCVCTSKKIWSMAVCGNVGEEKDQKSLKPSQGVTKARSRVMRSQRKTRGRRRGLRTN